MKRLKRAILKWLIRGNEELLTSELIVTKTFLEGVQIADLHYIDSELIDLSYKTRNGDD